ITVGDALVLAEQVADLASTDADVARRDVGVLAEMAVQLGHEALTEPHHLGVGAALRVEVAAALAAADRHAGECVLEDLLKPEELDRAERDRRVEPQPALVRAERAVVLDPVAAVDADPVLVVEPRHPEDDLAFGFDDPLDDAGIDIL